MSYGLVTYNNSGYVHIDSTFQNYYVLQRGYVNASAPTAINSISLVFSSGGGEVIFPAQPEPPLVLIRPAIGSYVFCYQTPTTSSFKVYVSSGESPVSCEYIVLARQYPVPSEQYGLNVYNQYETLVFTSSKNAATFSGVLNIPFGFGASTATVTVPAPLRKTFFLLNATTFAKWVKTGGLYNWGDVYASCGRLNSETSITCEVRKIVSGWNAAYPWGVWETPITTYPILIGDM